MKNEPNRAKNTRVMPPEATANRGFWKRWRSSIGCRLCSSHRMNATMNTAAMPNHSADSALIQPWCGPSMIAYTSELIPTIDSTAPSGSSGEPLESFDLGTRIQPAMRAAAMIGRLTRNTDPHQKCSRRKPDATGPSAAPPPEMPAQIAIALARSRDGNTLVSSDRVDGITNAAPAPMTARAKISMPELSESAPMSDPMPNTRRPACNAPLRPKRSPSAPAVNSRPANTRP